MNKLLEKTKGTVASAERENNRIDASIELEYTAFIPGHTVEGQLLLSVKETVTIDTLQVQLKCDEKGTKPVPFYRDPFDGSKDKYNHAIVYLKKRIDFLQQKPKELSEGTHAYSFSFTLPQHTPPSFFLEGGSDVRSRVKYCVQALIESDRDPATKALLQSPVEAVTCEKEILVLPVISRAQLADNREKCLSDEKERMLSIEKGKLIKKEKEEDCIGVQCLFLCPTVVLLKCTNAQRAFGCSKPIKYYKQSKKGSGTNTSDNGTCLMTNGTESVRAGSEGNDDAEEVDDGTNTVVNVFRDGETPSEAFLTSPPTFGGTRLNYIRVRVKVRNNSSASKLRDIKIALRQERRVRTDYVDYATEDVTLSSVHVDLAENKLKPSEEIVIDVELHIPTDMRLFGKRNESNMEIKGARFEEANRYALPTLHTVFSRFQCFLEVSFPKDGVKPDYKFNQCLKVAAAIGEAGKNYPLLPGTYKEQYGEEYDESVEQAKYPEIYRHAPPQPAKEGKAPPVTPQPPATTTVTPPAKKTAPKSAPAKKTGPKATPAKARPKTASTKKSPAPSKSKKM